jgi:hypothetical protein
MTNDAGRGAQLEERVRDLEHEDVRVPVVVDDEDALDGAPRAPVFVVVLQPLQPRRHRRVLLRLRVLRPVRRQLSRAGKGGGRT